MKKWHWRRRRTRRPATYSMYYLSQRVHRWTKWIRCDLWAYDRFVASQHIRQSASGFWGPNLLQNYHHKPTKMDIWWYLSIFNLFSAYGFIITNDYSYPTGPTGPTGHRCFVDRLKAPGNRRWKSPQRRRRWGSRSWGCWPRRPRYSWTPKSCRDLGRSFFFGNFWKYHQL